MTAGIKPVETPHPSVLVTCGRRARERGEKTAAKPKNKEEKVRVREEGEPPCQDTNRARLFGNVSVTLWRCERGLRPVLRSEQALQSSE